MNQAPSTPQRVFVQPPPTGINQIRPSLQTQSPNVYNNRSYSPHTPSSVIVVGPQPNQQIVRTPIQMMQQQTQSLAMPVQVMQQQQQPSGQIVVNSPGINSGALNSPSQDSLRKRHASTISSMTNHSAPISNSSVGSANSAAAIAVQNQQLEVLNRTQNKTIRKKGKLRDKIIPQKVRDLVPDSESYMDLLAFERKLDATIMRKKLDIQEALKRPIKIKRKLRVFITNQFYPVKMEADNDEDCVPQWELKIEGRLLEDKMSDSSLSMSNFKAKPRKFSSFFKSLVIELDKDLYGPDHHLVEWHRTPQTSETDGFQVKRQGDQSLKCTILMLLDYQPPQFKLDMRLAKLLSIHTATRPVIIQALWQYIKTHKLQDNEEKEYINLDKYLQQIFECERIRFSDIPNKLHMHCMPPDPIVINHMINIDINDLKRTSIYEIDVEIDDVLRDQMKSFLTTSQTQSLAEVAHLDTKINELIEHLNQLRINREFFMSFSEDPQDFINKWLISQSNDLKNMLDLNGNPEEERRAQFYHESWTDEAVCRYFYNRVQQRRAELEQVLGIRN